MKELLCFDFREALAKNATVDLNVWPNSNVAVDRFLLKYGDECRPVESYFSADFYDEIPGAWIYDENNDKFSINAYFVDSRDLSKIQNMYGLKSTNNAKDISLIRSYILSSWCSLGYDICTPDLSVSAISSVNELNFAQEKYMCFWNEYGLLKSKEACEKIISDDEFCPHDGVDFLAVEIYVSKINKKSV